MINNNDIQSIINSMSLDLKVGQLFLLAYPGKNPEIIKPLIDTYGISGCYISQDNAETFAEATYITNVLQSYAANLPHKIPMLLGVDQEGAWGVLVPESHTGPGNLALGAVDDPELTSEMYQIFGEEMLSVGYNNILAPCADVNSVSNSPIIDTRSFGEFPDKVAIHVRKAVEGAKRAGILTTLKHFPGHGSTNDDTHIEIPVVDRSIEELFNNDLLPFIEGINAGADIIMTSHIRYPQLDPDNPATLSPTILQKLLRDRLGFSGIILSDSMNMGAIRKSYNPAESTLQALQSGVDIVMLSEEHYDHDADYLVNQLKSLECVKNAIIHGQLSLEDVDKKLMRILWIKLNHMAVIEHPIDNTRKCEISRTEQKVAKKAITLVSDLHHRWPVNMKELVVCVNATPRKDYSNIINSRGIGPNQRIPAFDTFKEELERLSHSVRFVDYESVSTSKEILKQAKTILIITENYPLPGEYFTGEDQYRCVHFLLRNYRDKCMIIGLRSAYEVFDYPKDVSYISTFSSRSCSAVEMAKMIVSGEVPTGKSPISYNYKPVV